MCPPCLLSPLHLILSLTTQLLRMIWATQKGRSLHNASSTGLPLTERQEKQKLYSKQGHQSKPPSCLLTVWGVR